MHVLVELQYTHMHERRIVSEVGMAKATQSVIWYAISEADNGNKVRCWYSTEKVGVAVAAPTIRHSSPLPI